jgi:hypothetical protein
MKRLLFALIVMIVFVGLAFAGHGEKKKCNEEDVMAIKKVIKECYVKGVHMNRDVEALKKGFHPDFTILVKKEGGEMVTVPISKWIEKIKKWKEKEPELKTKYKHKLGMLDVAGNAAVARLDVFKEGKYAYTDYFSLYKFDDGWKIVNNVFYANKKHKKEKEKKKKG